jgi:hypothetical protein
VRVKFPVCTNVCPGDSGVESWMDSGSLLAGQQGFLFLAATWRRG